MVGKLTVTGKGQIGDLADGWTVQEDATPLYLNAASGSVGSVNFNGVRDMTTTDASEWAINNTATFTHTNESNPATGLGTISGIIDSVKTSGINANGTLSSIIDNLSVIRTAPTQGNYTKPRSVIGPVIPTALTDIGSFKGPKDIAFDSTGNMFVFDGFNCRVVKLTKISGVWQQTAYTSSGYNGGTGNGQFTDSGSIGAAGFIALDSSDNVFVTDTLGFRVQKFNNSLVYQSQFGTNGNGNGQFTSPTGIAIDSSNNIYVADSGANERIQKFNSAGTYVTQWGGTFGTGNSQFSNLIEGITLDLTGNVMVCDGSQISGGVTYGARIQKFSNTGGYQSQFGTYGRGAGQFAYSPTGIGAAVATGPFDSVVDSTGNIYVLDPANNRVQVFTSAYVYIGSFGAFGGSIGSFSAPRGIGRSPITGNVWVGDFLNNRLVEFQPATLSSPAYTFALNAVYQNYVNLALTGYTVNYIATSNPQVNYPSWTDNVWTKLNQLAAANNQEIAVVAGVITVRDIGSLNLSVTEAAVAPEVTIASSGTAQQVDITYQNTTYGDGVEFYNAKLAGQTFSIASGVTSTTTVNTNNYPNVVNSPVIVDSTYGPGMYQVLAAGNLAVQPSDWVASGAGITVAIGASPNQLDITLRGPNTDIVGYPGPYQIANLDATGAVSAALSITGSGALTSPTVLHLTTGADPAVTTTQVLTVSPDNIFLSTEAQAYDRGVWTADIVGGPKETIRVTIPIDQSSGFGLNSGSLVTYNNCTYRIESSTINNSSIQMTGTRRATSGQEAALWATRTAGDHATFWSGHPAEDATIAPLLN